MNLSSSASLFAGALLLTGLVCAGAEYHVDNLRGGDRNPGTAEKPFRSIRRGVSRLKAGDKLILKANPGKPYLENLVLRNLAGTAESPIVIEGGNAVLCGSVPADPGNYEKVGEGIFRRRLKLAPNRRMRYNLILENRYQRMGRAMKSGRKVPFKPVRDLKEGEWTYLEEEEMIYLRLGKGKKPGPDTVREPDLRLASGVMVSGTSRHIIIRGITVENFWNDGFNIHGDARDILFADIKAFYNGDDGISAHESAEIRVDGYEASGNSTGICHVNNSVAVHRNVKLSGNAGIELDLSNRHNEFENLEILSSAPRGINLNSKTLRIRGGRLVYRLPARTSIRTPAPDISGFLMP